MPNIIVDGLSLDQGKPARPILRGFQQYNCRICRGGGGHGYVGGAAVVSDLGAESCIQVSVQFDIFEAVSGEVGNLARQLIRSDKQGNPGS